MKLNIEIFLFTVLVGCASCAVDTLSTIERCKVEDEQCMVKAWNKMTIVANNEGIPELGLPISDKHFVDRQEIKIVSNLLDIRMLFKNLTVRGMAKTTYSKIKGFKKDPKQMSGFEMYGFCPYLSIRGNYTGSGKILLLPLAGSGDGEVKFYNVTFKITVATKAEEKDGEEYLVPTKVSNVNYQSERLHFRFENLLNNKELNDGVVQVMNENQDVFGKEINQAISKAFARIFIDIVIPVFTKHPYRNFFLE